MTKKQFYLISVCNFLAITTVFLVSYLIIGIKPRTIVYGYQFVILMGVIAFISLLLLMIMWSYVKRVRIRKLKSLASINGWEYEYFLDVPILKVLIDKLNLTLWINGLHSNYKDGIVGGINDWEFTIFDGNVVHADSNDTEQTIFVLNMKDENLPIFGLEPASLTGKLLRNVQKITYNRKKLNRLVAVFSAVH